MHKHEAFLIRQIQVVRKGRVRLGVGSVVFIRGKMSEDHRGRVDIVRRRRLLRLRGRGMERPLQEMDIGAGAGGHFLALGGLLFRCLAGQRENELRMLARGGRDALVGI